MDSIVTPEHLHALFYGFDKCTAIKKNVPLFHVEEIVSIIFSIPHSHRLSDSDSVSIAYSHPTVSITFVFLIICARFHLLSFIHFSLPLSLYLSHSHTRSYRFLGDCCASQQQPCCHSVISDMTVPLSPTFVSEPRVRLKYMKKKK